MQKETFMTDYQYYAFQPPMIVESLKVSFCWTL